MTSKDFLAAVKEQYGNLEAFSSAKWPDADPKRKANNLKHLLFRYRDREIPENLADCISGREPARPEGNAS